MLKPLQLSKLPDALRTLLALVLWVSIGLSAAKVTHDFYRYIDRSIHVTVDDGEANISYALATEGRYGFLSSPVLMGMDRTRAQFNYGPWYFYLAGGLIWLFGFSVTMLRSIHLWLVLGSIGLAGVWFGGRHRAAPSALFGLGILYCFDASQWPMIRPDILVSAFAVMAVICAGLGWEQWRARYWFGAGLAATCGAFTHLIAASLVPSVLAVFVLAWWFEGDAAHRWSWRVLGRPATALIAGIVVGLAMFYGAFNFDFAIQRQFFAAYRDLTASPDAYHVIVRNHLAFAFNYLSGAARWAVLGVAAIAWLGAILALRLEPAARRLVHAYVVPPIVVWTAYFVSNGFYPNYHQGYAILHQVLFLWTAAALLWVVLELADRRAVMLGTALAVAAMLSLVAQANQQLHGQFSETSWKILRSATWAPFSQYSERVLQPIPARATAWGSVVFGMEAPARIQLVQWADAVSVFPKIRPEARADLAPDYVIFGYAEARDNLLSALGGGETLLDRTMLRLPDVQLRLTSLVAAAPYGVTRTYARRTTDAGGSRALPLVSIYDAGHGQWLSRVGSATAGATFVATTPTPLRIGYKAEPAAAMPNATVVAELPAGRYLFKVSVRPGSGRSPRRLLTATSAGMLRQTIGEMGADGDFAAYLANDTEVLLVMVHPGGPLFISQFDDGTVPAIAAVETYPILGLLDPDEAPSQWVGLPPLEKWTPGAGVTALAEGSTSRVAGDSSSGGYQFSGPPIRMRPRTRVTARLPLKVEQGTVCSGVLNGDDSAWLVPPNASREDIQFTSDATQGFRVVVANCQAPGVAVASRFVVWPGSYLAEPMDEFYADRLIAAALRPDAAKPVELAGPEVRTFPSGLLVTKAEADSPVSSFTAQDFSYRANIVRDEAGTWTIKGRAEGQFSYLLQATPVRMTPDTRLVVSGRIEQGGVSVGLMRNNQWVGQVSVSEPGNFTVVLAPPASGTYALVVANNLRQPEALETAVVLSRFGAVRK